MKFKVLHKWVSLFVFLQLLVWLMTGFLLGKVDMQKAAGYLTLNKEIKAQTLSTDKLSKFNYLLNNYPLTTNITLTQLNEIPIYLLELNKAFHSSDVSEHVIIDAYSGHEIILDRDLAMNIALASYKGDAEINKVERLIPPIEDLPKERNSVWRIDLQDIDQTSIYVREQTGEVITHVNSETRWRDLLMMLHFMDYQQQGSFNNIFMKAFGVLMLLLTGTGFWWLVRLLIEKQVHLTWMSNKQQLIVNNTHGQVIAKVKVSCNTSLLFGLADNGIVLPSTCAGGGVCGRCRFKSAQNIQVLEADREHISETDIQRGYRLACQHRPEELQEIIVEKVTEDEVFQVQLVDSVFLTPFIKQLVFQPVADRSIKFSGGAHVEFIIPAAPVKGLPNDISAHFSSFWPKLTSHNATHSPCVRHYSLASHCDQSNKLIFNVKMQLSDQPEHPLGIGSFYLCNLPIGAVVNVKGPYQDFAVPNDTKNKELVLVGAGSGLAPLKAMIEEQLYTKSENTNAITLFYGVRDSVDLIHHAWLTNLEKEFPNFSYTPVVSQPKQTWSGATDYVQTYLEEYLESHLSISRCLFFLCGPTEMMRQTNRILKFHGAADNSIFIERFQTNITD
jgi:Na(+)-translocating NADH:ubiquinone oxidoreductase F subunit